MQSTPPQAGINHLQDLQHQVVRDLAWCCFSAPMMKDLPGTEAHILPFDNHSLWPWLHNLDHHPQSLLDHLNKLKSTRLGIYYEALWHFYFANHPEWELLQHNLQVDHAGVTLGAFDFLCRNGNEYWHIETAVKFYLCSISNPSNAYEWKYWVGPEGRDRLDLKLNHLRQHQLPLHQTPEAEPLLKKLYPQVRSWNTGLCLQGYLFSPAQFQGKPASSNPQHGRGSWRFASDLLDELKVQQQGLWKILERSQWLSPARETNQQLLLTGKQLAEKIRLELHQGNGSLLLALMAEHTSINANQNKSPYWFESQRIFVVPDTWPD